MRNIFFSIFLLGMFSCQTVSAQNLRRFGAFIGGYIPDASINFGVNYKLIDVLEVDAQVSGYALGMNGLNLGSKFFYHFGKKTEEFPLNSIMIGAAYEWRSAKSYYFTDENNIQGKYYLQNTEYLNFSIGFRYYASIAASGDDFFIKEVYAMPVITYFLPVKGTLELKEGSPDYDLEKLVGKYSNGGVNFLVRFGVIF